MAVRVLFIVPEINLGGPSRWVISLCKHFTRETQVAGVVCTGIDTDQSVEEELCRYAEVIHPNRHRTADGQISISFADARHAIRQAAMHADVIVSWGCDYLGEVTQGVRLPVVDVARWTPDWKFSQRTLKSSQGATHYVACSEAAKESFPESIRKEVQVLQNGVDFDRIVPTEGHHFIRAKYEIIPELPLTLFIGRYYNVKNPMFLLEVIDGFRQVGQERQWVFMGDTGAPANTRILKSQAALLDADITFVPYDPQIGNLLSMASCVAIPSETEAFPFVALEALAARVPVVISDCKFAREFESVNVGAFEIAPIDDAVAFGDAIARAERTDAHTKAENAALVFHSYNSVRAARRWEDYLKTVSWRGREEPVRVKRRKKRVHVVYDVQGWAFWHIAIGLEREAPDDWEVTVSTPQDMPDMTQVDVCLAFLYHTVESIRRQIDSTSPPTVLAMTVNNGQSWNGKVEYRDDRIKAAYPHCDYVIHNNLASFNVRGGSNHFHCNNGVDLNVFDSWIHPARREKKILWCGSERHKELKGYDILENNRQVFEDQGFVLDLHCSDSARGPRSQEQMADWYNTGSVYLCASETEGTPNPLLEASACGCSVVSTNVGNAPELIRSNINGLIVHSREAGHILAACQRAHENRVAWSQEMLRDIKDWSWEARAKEYFRLFDTFVKQRKKTLVI